MADSDKVVVGYHRAENTETASSPLTYANSGDGGAGAPSSTRPEHPTISNISLRSAVVGLTPERLRQLKKRQHQGDAKPEQRQQQGSGGAGGGENEEAEGKTTGAGGFPASTRRVQTLSFDFAGVSPPIVNLFRRLITTEVPTLAFDRVMIEENDSVVLDELLSHRLGLLPLAGPVDAMQYITAGDQVSFSRLDPQRTLLFELEAEGARDAPNTPVYSGQLRWTPLPGQEEAWGKAGAAAAGDADNDNAVFLVHKDILLTKLGPGQKLKLKAVAIKGLGGVHSKWSPVSTCYYEMKTGISLTEEVAGPAAQQLVSCCPMGVFDMEDMAAGGGPRAVVRRPEMCTLCRECLRVEAYPDFAEKIRIEKDKTRVRFHIESVGQRTPENILRTALTLFAERTRYLSNLIQQTEAVEVDMAARGGAY